MSDDELGAKCAVMLEHVQAMLERDDGQEEVQRAVSDLLVVADIWGCLLGSRDDMHAGPMLKEVMRTPCMAGESWEGLQAECGARVSCQTLLA